jgi:hypothetical protein
MVAAALTLWVMFSVWLIASAVGIQAAIATTAAGLAVSELVALLWWSYGVESCARSTCRALTGAVGSAATVDIPLLAGLFLVLALVKLGRGGAQRVDKRRRQRMSADSREEQVGDAARRIVDERGGDPGQA